MKNEVKAKRSDNEQADLNDSGVALNGFLDLPEHDISNTPEKLVEALAEELKEIISDYQVDLDGKY